MKPRKRKGKSETIFDVIDYDILRMLKIHGKLTITGLRNIIELTHANLTTHLIRLMRLIDRKRDKQTIYITINRDGKNVLKMIDKYFPTQKLKIKRREIEKSFR